MITVLVLTAAAVLVVAADEDKVSTSCLPVSLSIHFCIQGLIPAPTETLVSSTFYVHVQYNRNKSDLSHLLPILHFYSGISLCVFDCVLTFDNAHFENSVVFGLGV